MWDSLLHLNMDVFLPLESVISQGKKREDAENKVVLIFKVLDLFWCRPYFWVFLSWITDDSTPLAISYFSNVYAYFASISFLYFNFSGKGSCKEEKHKGKYTDWLVVYRIVFRLKWYWSCKLYSFTYNTVHTPKEFASQGNLVIYWFEQE